MIRHLSEGLEPRKFLIAPPGSRDVGKVLAAFGLFHRFVCNFVAPTAGAARITYRDVHEALARTRRHSRAGP